MKAILITREQKARDAPESWRKQYPGIADQRKAEIGRQLAAAVKAPSFNASLVDAIIGNRSWTNITCDGCGASDLERAVIVGEPQDDDSATSTLCEACLREALDVLISPSSA